jgi:hypothetical protein
MRKPGEWRAIQRLGFVGAAVAFARASSITSTAIGSS